MQKQILPKTEYSPKIGKNTYVTGIVALIIANLIWAAASPIIKLTIQTIPPFTFLFLRFLAVSIILLPSIFLQLTSQKVDPRDYWKIFLLSVFAQSAIILIVLGLKYTTAVDSAIISILGTMLAMAAGHYLFNEKMHKGIVYGLIIASIGTIIVILEPLYAGGYQNHAPSSLRFWGNILVATYNIAFLFYIVWSKIIMGQKSKIIKKTLKFMHLKPFKGNYSAVLLTFLSFYVGMITMLPLAFLESLGFFGNYSFSFSDMHGTPLFGFIYMVIFSSIIAYTLFEWSLNWVSVADTAIFNYMSAVLTIPFAFLLLAELPTPIGIVGSLIIAVGVVISEISIHQIKIKKHFKI